MQRSYPNDSSIPGFEVESPGRATLLSDGRLLQAIFEDAVTASRTMDVTLTARGQSGGNPVPMCGVPYHSADTYLTRLLDAGFNRNMRASAADTTKDLYKEKYSAY